MDDLHEERRGLSRRGLLTGAAAAAAASAVLVSEPAAAAGGDLHATVGTLSRPKNLRRIVDWTAAELSVAIKRRVVTCVEVMTAYLDQIDEFNPSVNAIVALRPRAELLAEAAEKDALLRRGRYQGWMHGFPQAVKDLANVIGLPTSAGFFRDSFAAAAATADSIFVERVRAAGAIFIGKTNTPEFGLGSNTYNNVYGTTYNAYDQTKSAGGSSGGAAVAVALKMLPVADGSDFFGSLRNPPGWNNVYGLRPSYGRVPGTGPRPYETFVAQGGTEGPIARNPQDLALMLETMAGYDARQPLSIDSDFEARGLSASMRGKKVAWLGDLGGYLPMEPEVLQVTKAALKTFRSMGMSVTTIDELPSITSTTGDGFAGNTDLWPTWLTFRHWIVGSGLSGLAAGSLGQYMKPEAIYEVEGVTVGADGNAPISGLDAFNGSVKRTAMYRAFQEQIFNTYDYVVLPTAQVFPFTVAGSDAINWPESVNGVEMSSYHRWMEVTAIGTLLNAPTVAMPAGFSDSGLPIGLQAIGRNHDDIGVLRLAQAWEKKTRWSERKPPLLD
ncbi:MAG: amidase [Microbacterium sp.]|uniref:amidase n=1 Tax=Microbacterium sp. TaxID=51671 RepID=UPI0039E4CAF3